MTTLEAVAPTAPQGRRNAGHGDAQEPMLRAARLKKHFASKVSLFSRSKTIVQAVDDVSFDVKRSETLGIVGESGCGKSTTARMLMHLIRPDSGSIVFEGKPVGSADGLSHRDLHRRMQMVFQDSYSSLNPRLPVAMSIAFGPWVHGVPRSAALARATDLLQAVGLEPRMFANRYPHELSGGQRQRINIARALALEPRLVILDEAVSALDKSVEAQVLNLLVDLKAQFDLTYIFISHDLSVVAGFCDRVMVMYAGRVVETADTRAIFREPKHPYTRALQRSRPAMQAKGAELYVIPGLPPDLSRPVPGCAFAPRCEFAVADCGRTEMRLQDVGAGQASACLRVQRGELTLQ